AVAATPAKTIATSAAPLRVHMFDLTRALDAPARERVVVLCGKTEDVWNRLGFAAAGDDFGARRLNVAGLVPRAALQNGRPAVPAPGRAEPGERLCIDRLLQEGLRPALAAVGRHHDLRDPAVARVGEAGDFVQPRTARLQAG